jgi:WD40 repeat protein
VGFHCEGKWVVTSSEDGTVRIWDTRSGQLQRDYNHGSPVNDVVIHPNQGELISCDQAGNVKVWDLSESKCSHQLIPEEDVPVRSVSVASDGSMLCAGNNNVSSPFPGGIVLAVNLMVCEGECLRMAYDPTPRRYILGSDLQIPSA